jgi:hypothetical protein
MTGVRPHHNCTSTMSDAETNDNRKRSNALKLGPRKSHAFHSLICFSLTTSDYLKNLVSCNTDPLIHHGHHFCRTVHALCNVQALLTNGILRSVELAEEPEENFTAE